MKVIEVIVAAVLAIAIGIMLLMIVGRTEGAPARRRFTANTRQRELRIARDRFTAGMIDADQYERIVEALRR